VFSYIFRYKAGTFLTLFASMVEEIGSNDWTGILSSSSEEGNGERKADECKESLFKGGDVEMSE
jgi:hypothetical protein